MLGLTRQSTGGERLRNFAHFWAGLLIILKADVVAETHRSLAIILLFCAILFILVSAFARKIEPVIGLKGESVLFLLEAMTVSVVAYQMIAEHKHYLQYAYAFAAAMYV